jgi:hypothetical protein
MRSWVIQQCKMTLFSARPQSGKSNAINLGIYKAMSMNKVPFVFMNSATKLPITEFYNEKLTKIASGLGVNPSIIRYSDSAPKMREFISEVVGILRQMAVTDNMEATATKPRVLLIRMDEGLLDFLESALGNDKHVLLQHAMFIGDELHGLHTMAPLTGSKARDFGNDLNNPCGGKKAENVFLRLLGEWSMDADGKRRLTVLFPFHFMMVDATPEDLFFMQHFFNIDYDVKYEDRNKTAGYRGHVEFEKIYLEDDELENEEPVLRKDDGTVFMIKRQKYIGSFDHFGKISNFFEVDDNGARKNEYFPRRSTSGRRKPPLPRRRSTRAASLKTRRPPRSAKDGR